jgi:hypothetical protein
MKSKLHQPKKPHRKEAVRGVALTTLAASTGVARKTLGEWEKAGMPTTSTEAAMRWMVANRPDYFQIEGSTDQKQWTKADWEKHKLRYQALTAEHRHKIETGEAHNTEQCCKSITGFFSEGLQPLLSVGSRLAAQFPELGQRLRDAADKEIDAAMAQIREGLK